MPNIHAFAATYSEARDKFLSAARLAGAVTHRYDNPTKGPKGETLSCDVAWLGADDASKVVVAISATHGVEGYCGSGFQIDWLASVGAAGLSQGTAAVFVHAINPYGFAWTRRVTEEGNDLNRNYVDHSTPYPISRSPTCSCRLRSTRPAWKPRTRALPPTARGSGTSPTSAPYRAASTATLTAFSMVGAVRAGPIGLCTPSSTDS